MFPAQCGACAPGPADSQADGSKCLVQAGRAGAACPAEELQAGGDLQNSSQAFVHLPCYLRMGIFCCFPLEPGSGFSSDMSGGKAGVGRGCWGSAGLTALQRGRVRVKTQHEMRCQRIRASE